MRIRPKRISCCKKAASKLTGRKENTISPVSRSQGASFSPPKHHSLLHPTRQKKQFGSFQASIHDVMEGKKKISGNKKNKENCHNTHTLLHFSDLLRVSMYLLLSIETGLKAIKAPVSLFEEILRVTPLLLQVRLFVTTRSVGEIHHRYIYVFVFGCIE